MPRKHLVASATNKKQQANAKLWHKAAKEIKAAVKVGGANVDANPRLKYAIQRALDVNLSRDSIEKNIKSSKDESKLEEMDFEAFGPGGVALVIHALSDNVNRVAGAVRGYLTKLGTTLAKPGAAMVLFESKGQVFVAEKDASEEKILDSVGNVPIEDVFTSDGLTAVVCAPEHYGPLKEALEKAGVPIAASELGLYAASKVDVHDEKELAKIEAFLARCEEDDDISWVATNLR